MANENSINTQNDQLKNLLGTTGITTQEISNFEDFKDYSKDELLQMKKDSVKDKTITDGEKYWVRHNIDNILDARDKEEESLQSQKDEEERQEKQKEIDQEKAEAKNEQNDEAERLKKEYLGDIEETPATIGEETPATTGEDSPVTTSEDAGETTGEETPATTGEEAPATSDEEAPATTGQETPATTTEENNNYQGQIDALKKSNEELKGKVDEQTKQIEALLAAKKESNNEEINKMKEDLKKSREDIAKIKKERDKLLKDNQKMKDTYFGELPKYNGNIIPLKTKAIEFKFGQNEIVGNQRVLSMPQLRLRKNIISRHRLNKTIRKLNEIGDDPKKGVNYVLTKADFFKGGAKIGTLCKKIGKYFTIRDVDSFDQKFNEQKKIFIDDIEAKMQGQMTEDDKKTIKAIKDRLDYYQKAYKRKFLTV